MKAYDRAKAREETDERHCLSRPYKSDKPVRDGNSV